MSENLMNELAEFLNEKFYSKAGCGLVNDDSDEYEFCEQDETCEEDYE